MHDDEIINNIRAKDYSKVTKVWYRYFPVIKKYILKNNGSTQDASDIFQDTLVLLFQKISDEKFILTSTLDTYLFGVSKNLWYEELRRRSKFNLTQEVYLEDPAPRPMDYDPEDFQDAKNAYKAVSQLGRKCKELLLLFYFKKRSMGEIAKKLGYSGEKTAKNQKYRCLEKAKEIYSTIK